MNNVSWLPPMLTYALESAIEVVIIYLVVLGILHLKRMRHADDRGRYLLLPLVIPVVFTPFLHLVFPQLEHLILIRQVERGLPWLRELRSYEEYALPWLAMALVSILLYNLVRMLAITLLERRNANPLVPSIELSHCENVLQSLAKKFGLPEPVLVLSDRRPFAAHCYGWRRPVVTLGREWLAQLDEQELEAVLAHELAHFKQKDQLLMLVAQTCRDLLFFNPLVHSIFHRLHLAREEAADIRALQITRNPLALASGLLKFWHVQQPKPLRSGEVSFTGSGNRLEQRIQRLVEPQVEEPALPYHLGLFYSVSISLTLIFSLI